MWVVRGGPQINTGPNELVEVAGYDPRALIVQPQAPLGGGGDFHGAGKIGLADDQARNGI